MKALLQEYEKQLAYYSQQVRGYINEHGNDNCEYLLHRRFMVEYYRGACNALIEVEKLLDN